MRTIRWTYTMVAVASMALSSLLSAQAPTDRCDAAGSPTPSCNKTRPVTTTVPSVLVLGISSSGTVDLQASDTLAYEKTYAANGNAAGTSGTPVTTPATLQSASAHDSVIVRANRKYTLGIDVTTDYFTFAAGASGLCRGTDVSATCTASSNAANGKPVSDLYWSTDDLTFTPVKGTTASATTPAYLTTSATGGRYAKSVYFKSAWFYASDVPGVYSAIVRYTLTGQ